MGDWSKKTKAAHKIIMEISLLMMEKSWNNHGIWILNFCGNPVNRVARITELSNEKTCLWFLTRPDTNKAVQP